MATELTAVVVTMLFTIATSVPIGLYMARVFSGQRTSLDAVFLPIERLVLKVTGVDAALQPELEGILALASHLERRDVAGVLCAVVTAARVAAQP